VLVLIVTLQELKDSLEEAKQEMQRLVDEGSTTIEKHLWRKEVARLQRMVNTREELDATKQERD